MPKLRGTYKRGNIWWITYAGPDGKVRRESSHSTKLKVAQALLISRKNASQEGKEPLPVKKIANHTFNELAERYCEWAERQKSIDSKKYLIKRLVLEFKNTPLRRFNTLVVEEHQTKILTSGRTPATANRYLATLKHMFTKAVEWEMIDQESAKRVKRVKFMPEDNKRLRFLTSEEMETLVDACIPHLKPIIVTALNTGMRREEILSLEWDKHIDLKHDFILLDKTKNGERRQIPINQTLRNTFLGLVRRLDSPYVFIKENGERFREIKRSFNTAVRRAGIKDFTFHDLRHTFASHLVMKGADITTVKELLGHQTLAMTLRYAHLAPEHKAKAVCLLDDNTKKSSQLVHSFTKKGLALMS